MDLAKILPETLADVGQRSNGKPEPRARVKGRKDRAAGKVRKTVRERVVMYAQEKCQRCLIWTGDWGHAHHRIPRARGGKWTADNIEYLCAWCHLKAHRTNTL